jgi:hypothetical protein
MKNNRQVIYFTITAVVLFLGFVFYSNTQNSKNNLRQPSLYEEKATSTLYVNPDFKVLLRYPSYWEPDITKSGFNGSYLSFKDIDGGGFFGIDAVRAEGSISIEQAAQNVAQGDGKPYGLTPMMSVATIAGMEARIIEPSADQLALHKNEVGVIIRYPKPIEVSGRTYYFVILYGDKEHIESLAGTLQFIE